MVRDLVEGVNIFGEGRWKDIQSAYDFLISNKYLLQKWKKLKKDEVEFKDKRWVLAREVRMGNTSTTTDSACTG